MKKVLFAIFLLISTISCGKTASWYGDKFKEVVEKLPVGMGINLKENQLLVDIFLILKSILVHLINMILELC